MKERKKVTWRTECIDSQKLQSLSTIISGLLVDISQTVLVSPRQTICVLLTTLHCLYGSSRGRSQMKGEGWTDKQQTHLTIFLPPIWR